MEPWVAIVLTGAAIAGYGWLLPAGNAKTETASGTAANEEAYDRLLEDLETENRELVDAVVKFKREQDETVDRLGRRIRELERQMSDWKAADASPRQAAEAPASVGSAAIPAERSDIADSAAAIASRPNAAVDLPAAEPALSDAAADGEQGSAASTIRGRYAELISLYERGRSIEQIAKALHLNKGEVQLILQLAKREVGQRA
ncbi:hypothetical protein [Cohnella zeiphila]|uniref:Uncharacterized protein n=1 Tax=Cohnella zeiphila TaxID=2761120 RepID=A0A7X0VW70_9BACL|nr:hypothetical protein [Cohnella zeiphila]MBB6732879.1 hypothetical protein [Cohnella zeiphila]